MHSLVRRLRDERGIALVMAMGILLVISISLTGVIYFTSTNSRSSSYAKGEQSSLALAEAGLNNAVAAVTDPENDVNLDDPTWLGSAQNPITSTYPGGKVTWYGELKERNCSDASPPVCQLYWLITATGVVANPTGPTAADIRRTLTLTIGLKAPPSFTEGLEIWNWVYSNRTGNTCDMTIDQGVNMSAPVYVNGNLCMRSTAQVSQGPLVVGGNLSMSEPQTAVAARCSRANRCTPLQTSVRIGGSCKYSNNAAVSPCRAELSSPPTNVWTTDFGTNPADIPISLPGVWWWKGDVPVGHEGEDGWYEKASPGPFFPCRTVSGAPPTFENFYNPAVMDASVPGVVNLTPPGQSYTCKTRRGQLSWNNATRTLTVRGVMFIDGDAKIDNNAGVIQYVQEPETACTQPPQPGDTCGTGSVIYLGGTLSIKNSKLCAVVSGNDCNWSGWQPNMNLLVFCTYRDGRQLSAGNGIEVVSSSFQGALYGKHAIQVSTSSTVQGPLVSETQVDVGQSNSSSFPRITINPIGMPGFGPEFYSALDPEYG